MTSGDQREKPDGVRASLREAGPCLGLGMQLAATLVVFVLGGYFLDQWLGTLPWFLIAGALVGLIMIFVHLYRMTIDIERRSNRRKR